MREWIRRSFRNRIFVTVLMVAMVPLFVFDLVMVPMLPARSEGHLAQQAQVQLTQVGDKLGGLWGSFEEITDVLARDMVVQTALSTRAPNPQRLYRAFYQAVEGFQEYARFDIFDARGRCCYSTSRRVMYNTMDLDWGLLHAASGSGGLVFRTGDQPMTLTASRAIRAGDGDILGYVVLFMTQENFDLLFDGLYDPASDIVLLNPTWHPIYCSQPSQADATAGSLRDQLLRGVPLTGARGESHYSVLQQEKTDFYLILQRPKTFTAVVMNFIYVISAAMGLLCLLLCLYCAWVLSRHLSQPVHQLDSAMGEIEKGNFDVHLENDREDELGRLASTFNRMTTEYRLNLERSVQRQKELNETRLLMMQAQLNPHFLYNTLDSMKWLGVTHHVPQVATLATDLATILRAGISGDEFVTLEDELELIDRYIDIQTFRFEDRFTCEFDIDERFRGCFVPKLVLQPLVENAIIHGVADRDDGYVKLWAEEKDGDLILSVSDNGCGIPPEILAQLNSGDKQIPGGHLGLYNVDSIIRLNFGDSYGISAESGAEGSCVHLRLPISRKGKIHA